MYEYGHWVCDFKIDVENYIGFVYVLTMSNGQKYIGAKKMWVSIKRPPASFKRKPKKPFKESNWRSYTSSSKHVNTMFEQGVFISEFRIVSLHETWGQTLFSEAMLQLELDAIRSDFYLNKRCEGNFTSACWQNIGDVVASEMRSNAIDSTPMYKLGYVTKYVTNELVDEYKANGWNIAKVSETNTKKSQHNHKDFTIIDLETNEKHVINDQNVCAIKLGIHPTSLSKLRSGDILKIDNKWILENTIRPKTYVDNNNNTYTSLVDGAKACNMSQKEFKEKCTNNKDGFYVLERESKKEFKARLAQEQEK